MGCFSYICKVSGEPVLSTSFDGEPVHLFLIEDGIVQQHMFGNYDSYGRVFDETGDGSFEWVGDWGDLVTQHFNGDPTSGFAAIKDKHYDGTYPTTISDDDPNQGWGDDDFGYIDVNMDRVEEPFNNIMKSTQLK
jgi:hypothetical protein